MIALTSRKAGSRGCYGSSEVEIVEPARSCEAVPSQTGLWILPDLWKAQTAPSHRSLDGANGCAARRLHEALLVVSLR